MMKPASFLLIALTAFTLSGCTAPDDASGRSDAPKAAVPDPGGECVSVLGHAQPPHQVRPIGPADAANPSVGHLKTRDKLITIRSGPTGPLYTVKSLAGNVLAVDLSPSALVVRFPDLNAVTERGVADWAGTTSDMQFELLGDD